MQKSDVGFYPNVSQSMHLFDLKVNYQFLSLLFRKRKCRFYLISGEY